MAALTDDDIRHIAKLCRLNLTDEEVKKFGPELSSILTYFDMLNEVDTEEVEALSQVTGMENSFREDALRTEEDTVDPKKLLECSPLPIIDNQIQTPSAHG